MKVAIIHDWLVEKGGAEIVLKELISIFPESDVFTIVDYLSDSDRDYYLSGKVANTSFIQKLPFSKKNIVTTYL